MMITLKDVRQMVREALHTKKWRPRIPGRIPLGTSVVVRYSSDGTRRHGWIDGHTTAQQGGGEPGYWIQFDDGEIKKNAFDEDEIVSAWFVRASDFANHKPWTFIELDDDANYGDRVSIERDGK